MGIAMWRWSYVIQSMKDLGAAVFEMNASDITHTSMPDTAGKTQDEIDTMPPYVRSFRCGSTIELGDPTCKADKYTILPNDDPCNGRKGRVRWHPGWYVIISFWFCRLVGCFF